MHAVYDLGAGGFSHFELTDKHGAEALDRGAAIRGEIRLADRNYSNAKGLRRLRESVGKTDDADYLVRLRWSSLRLRGVDDKKFDLAGQHLRNTPADKLTDDLVVWIEGAGAPMRTRIVIRRKSEEAAQAERQRLLSQARKKGKTLDPRSLLAAEFVVLATSLDAETYPADELLAMYRLRWQIELAFKRLKSLLNLDRLPARTEKGARSWIWAHLILAIATDDYSQGFLELFPLWTCSTPDTARRSGVSRRSSSGYCAQLSWDTSPSNASKPPTPASTACSLSRPESEKTRCNTRSAPYPSAYAAYRPSSRFAVEAVEFVSGLDFPPTGTLRTAPAGLLGPSFIRTLLQLARRKGTAEADSRVARRGVQKHDSAPVAGSRRHRQKSASADFRRRRAARSTTSRPIGFTGSWFMARLRSLVFVGDRKTRKEGPQARLTPRARVPARGRSICL